MEATLMKLAGAIGTAVLTLTLGAGITAYAQQDQHDQQENKDKPAQEKEKKAQPEKSVKQDEKNARQEEKNKPEEKNAQEAKPGKQDEHAGRIPDDRYRANFGQNHRFRVSEGD